MNAEAYVFVRRTIDRIFGILVFWLTGIPGFRYYKLGAQSEQVGEHLRPPCATFIFEIEAYPEPKSLSAKNLKVLCTALGGFRQVANRIGASEAFVRQTCQSKKYKNTKAKNQPTPTKEVTYE